jgi:diguanylate cyclase (GGDEF)-like protein/PAS domain S-box-containing protein
MSEIHLRDFDLHKRRYEMNLLFELVYNLSILVSISIISGFIGHRGNKDWSRALLQGVLFGSASVIGMLHPLTVAPGLIFDGRSVMISLSGLFFGPLAAAVAGTMALVLRILQGGVGTMMGALVIISSALLGTLFYFRNKQHNCEIMIGQLLYFGVVVHAAMILLMFTLPGGKGISTIKLIGLPILFSYPLATILIGRILSESNERIRTIEALRESQINLSSANEELNATMDELVTAQEELRSQFEELQINEERFRTIFEQSPVGITLNDSLTGRFSKVNSKFAEITGRTMEELVKIDWMTITHPDDVKNNLINQKDTKEFNVNKRYIKPNGDIVWTNVTKATLRFSDKVNSSELCLIEDITDRKKMELELEYLSYHDQLTGLYNRRFFEEELKRLDVERNFPLAIVMADVNGLKLVNDSLGHAMGDELLRKVAEIIQKGCRADDIVARLGGDEFVILLPQTDLSEVDEIIKRIKAIALNEKVGSVDISVSFGYETKENENVKIQEIFKKAEDHMYKKKLFESPSMRGKTINTIISTLHEKNKREEQHSHRVSALCKIMGETIGLSEEKILELKIVGLLHDIGKIAIDENILNKSTELTKDEWEEIKRHPEVGYRILSTVNNMSEMAEFVLAHHERWDGNGYPKGLDKENIPLQSRIIAIADAYDAMTSERSYRSALPEEIAIRELRRNAGTQFDSELVKIFIEKVLKV